jgi:hypothetical protein
MHQEQLKYLQSLQYAIQYQREILTLAGSNEGSHRENIEYYQQRIDECELEQSHLNELSVHGNDMDYLHDWFNDVNDRFRSLKHEEDETQALDTLVNRVVAYGTYGPPSFFNNKLNDKLTIQSTNVTVGPVPQPSVQVQKSVSYGPPSAFNTKPLLTKPSVTTTPVPSTTSISDPNTVPDSIQPSPPA